MNKLLVNAPSGAQEVIEVGEGGYYFEADRVLWDERDDGPLPEITLGGMVRQGGELAFDQVRMDEHVAASTPAPLARHLTVLAFRNRFTKAEKIRVELAAIDNPSSTPAERERAALVRVGQADLAAATYVDVDRVDTREDVLAFEALGLLDAPGRALEILDNEIEPHERHYG